MSRMHDALKKAEEERVSSAVPEEGRRLSESNRKDDGQREISRSVLPESSPRPATPVSNAAYNPLDLRRLLLDRCARRSWDPDRKMMLSFDRRGPVVGLEEFRTLRSHLYLIREQQRQLQKLLVTSPLPLEGKTFVATNLAQVIARQHERSVLLVDADLRRPQMHLSFGAPRIPGLSDYLAGEADEFSVVHRGPVDNLFFIPGGKPVSNPTELLGTGRLKLLLDRLIPAFDWIILDSPPVIPVSDAKLLADLSDGVLVVIRAGATPFDLAQKTCQLFSEKRLLGVVLNGVKGSDGYHAYYYGKKYQSPKDGNQESGGQ